MRLSKKRIMRILNKENETLKKNKSKLKTSRRTAKRNLVTNLRRRTLGNVVDGGRKKRNKNRKAIPTLDGQKVDEVDGADFNEAVDKAKTEADVEAVAQRQKEEAAQKQNEEATQKQKTKKKEGKEKE